MITVSINDCRIDTFTVSGAGGQRRNSKQTGVRITHDPSGAVGEGREFREQHRNKVAAFRRMGESEAFRTWARMMVREKVDVEAVVEEMMRPENIKVECYDVQEQRWVKYVEDSDDTGAVVTLND